jgi:indolepyruvate ferredoxin oxidoreductase alpha subunit
MRVVSVIGDSTFFHSGMTGLLDITYNGGNSTVVILDNRITGMTGHQENPGTGYTLMGKPAREVDLVKLVEALGIEDVDVVNPLKLDEVDKVIEKHLNLDKPSVIITKWPCALKKFRKDEIKEYKLDERGVCVVESDTCKKCKKCTKVGCPAISFTKEEGAKIDPYMCVGCEVCMQVCPFDAIKLVQR